MKALFTDFDMEQSYVYGIQGYRDSHILCLCFFVLNSITYTIFSVVF